MGNKTDQTPERRRGPIKSEGHLSVQRDSASTEGAGEWAGMEGVKYSLGRRAEEALY